MTPPSRRSFLGLLAASAVLPFVRPNAVPGGMKARARKRSLRIRTITAGVGLENSTGRTRVETAIALLERAKKSFEADDYEVQTLRVATPPIMAEADDRAREAALAPLRALEATARREGRVYLGIDPSPAPGKDRSIGAAIEALTRVPFGSASTLDACAA